MNTTHKKLYKAIEIPARLKDDSRIRYILIKKAHEDETLKRPKELKWQTENNYPANAPKLIGWLRGGGNYGIVTGYDDLAIFDADELARLRELGVIGQLPETFTVATGGNGEHHFYWIEGLQGKIIMYDKELVEEDGTPLHLGEILSKRNFAIGPNCNHRSGRKYEVINDAPIAKLSYEDLMEILSPVNTKKKTDSAKREYRESDIDIPINKIAWPLHAKETMGSNGREVVGEHPLHGATKTKDRGKSRNFSINIDKNVWTCRACGSGGGPLEWLAVVEGIINCNEAGKGCLDKEKFKRVLRAAEERGLIEKSKRTYERSDSKKTESKSCSEEENCCDEQQCESKKQTEQECSEEQNKHQETTTSNHLLLEKLPDDLPPDGTTGIKASPRRGKTHWATTKMVQMGEGNFITHRHAIIKHAIRSFKEQGGKDFIWVEGRSQPGMCRMKRSTCNGCPMKPQNFSELEEMKEIARQILKKDRFLTKDNVPLGMCPYYTLKFSEPYAAYCFTVVNNVPVRGMHGITPRKLTIFDEDTTLAHFYTPSVEIAKVKIRRGERHVVNGLVDLDEDIREILEEQKRPGLRAYAKKIKEMSEILEAINETGIDTAVDKITEALQDWAPKKKYIRDEPDEEHVTLGVMVNCMSNIYKAKPITVTSSKGGYKTIHLLGDARKAEINDEWWSQSQKIVIMGATHMERMVNQLGGIVWEIAGFPYSDRFVVIPIEAEKTPRQGEKQAQQKKLLDILRLIAGDGESDTRMPMMVLGGSKAVQRVLVTAIGPTAHASTTEQEKGQKMNYLSGAINVFYQNSIISRGLDVDQYSLLVAYDSNFAQPFWGAVDENVARAITKDETTNSVLRISPTQRKDNKKARIVLIPAEDLWKVQYLEGRVAKVAGTAEEIATLVKRMKLGGEIAAIDDMIKATNHGILAEGAIEKIELMAVDGDLVADDVIAATSAMVMTELKKRGDKWTATREIQKGVSVQRSVLITTLKHLYRIGEIEVNIRGSYTFWRENNSCRTVAP